jgi:hypothetical protein
MNDVKALAAELRGKLETVQSEGCGLGKGWLAAQSIFSAMPALLDELDRQSEELEDLRGFCNGIARDAKKAVDALAIYAECAPHDQNGGGA